MIKVSDVAWVRFSAPDLDEMERFGRDFGLVRAARTPDALYLRGSDPDPWIHVTHRGAPGFLGLAFECASAADLKTAAGMEGASAVEPVEEPGGGARVRMRDPDGFAVELVHGRIPVPELPVERALPGNTGGEQRRIGRPQRIPQGPARVKRLGHVVVRVADFPTSAAWYESCFGLLRSDEIYLGDPSNLITAFMRCDRGEIPVDHHSFLCVGIGEPGFEHAAFEVQDIDAVMTGHEHLREAGWKHHAGIGRHLLGSQVFDYWRDPWGHVVEHFTDGDLFDASLAPTRYDPAVGLGSHWGGPAAPA